jgi:hypothetical protein
MLRKHAHTVAMINRDRRTAYLLRDYFDLPRSTSLMPALLARGLGQADLVLALLRLRDQATPYSRLFRVYVELLVGHPITVGPACLLHYKTNTSTPTIIRAKDDRRLTYVAPANPRQPRTEAHMRWSLFQVGRSISQLRVRGVTKRDIRRAARRGWIRIEELA